MKTSLTIIGIIFLHVAVWAQQVIELPYEEIEGVEYAREEREYYSEIWRTTVVNNVSIPTMTVHQPSVDKRNGTAVIIAPGGGLFALSINSEGVDVANWLVAKGITAFVLKYRLVPTGEDGVADVNAESQADPEAFMNRVQRVLPSSIQDGLNAVKHVRQNAEAYGIDPDKIGFMGFSAGGAVTMGVAYNSTGESKANFTVPVYAWTDAFPVREAPEDAAPMMIICATDDPLNLAPGSIELYQSWYKSGVPTELHMYSQGGHGFGMRSQGLPSDDWIQLFYDWTRAEGLVE